jgi:hypothetical protein
MRHASRLLVPVILIAATVAPVVASGGNANFVLGGRTLTDDEFWEPNEDNTFIGATVSFGPRHWPISLSAGTYISFAQERVSIGSFSGDFTTAIAEFDFGVQKTWEIDTVRPYVGGGIASVGAAAELEGGGSNVDDDDQSFGAYVDFGVFWRLGSRFNIGIHTRAMFGTDVEFDFGGPLTAKGDADYLQVGLILGWGWPSE